GQAGAADLEAAQAFGSLALVTLPPARRFGAGARLDDHFAPVIAFDRNAPAQEVGPYRRGPRRIRERHRDAIARRLLRSEAAGQKRDKQDGRERKTHEGSFHGCVRSRMRIFPLRVSNWSSGPPAPMRKPAERSARNVKRPSRRSAV